MRRKEREIQEADEILGIIQKGLDVIMEHYSPGPLQPWRAVGHSLSS